MDNSFPDYANSIILHNTLDVPNIYQLVTIQHQDLSFFGHTIRDSSIERLFMEGMVVGKRRWRWWGRWWSQDIVEWMGSLTIEGRKKNYVWQEILCFSEGANAPKGYSEIKEHVIYLLHLSLYWRNVSIIYDNIWEFYTIGK